MKKFFLVNLILLTCLSLTAQLRWLNPTPSGWGNTKIHFINDSTGYLMNRNGDLFTTKDTGNTWQSHGHFPTAQTFEIRNSIGVIPCNDSTIYVSSDNGLSWVKTLTTPAGYINSEWCDIVGSDTIFVQGFTTVECLYKSVNRGVSWQLVTSDIYPFYHTSIDFITSQRGYGLKPDGIYKTTDGGVTWQQKYNVTSSANVTTMKFYDTLRGIAYRQSIGMLRTVNGGVTWTLSADVPAGYINDIFFVDSLHVYACGESGLGYKSSDGGVTWNLSLSQPQNLNDLNTQYFFNLNYGILAGFRGRIVKTRDGGTTWQAHSPTYIDVTGISFGNATTGYASTWNNIYKTTNSGLRWDSLALTVSGIPNTRFEHIRFINKDTGIATSRDPLKIYRTVNGGQSWTVNDFFPLPTTYSNISSMSFVSKDTGYASVNVFPVHKLYKTHDAGFTWSEVGVDQDLTLLFFLTDKFGYGTKYDRVYRTSDGGINWTMMPVPPASHPFTSIWFVNPSKGFTVGDQGQLKMTVDSGYHWTDIVLDPFALPDYITISFYNDRIGYITEGTTGNGNFRIYKTIDSGYHWKINIITPNKFSRILYRPDTTVVFAGLYGSIVTRDISDYGIDSVQVTAGICNAQFKTKISAFLSAVDSTWFQYGKNGYTDIIAGSPVRVADTSLRITATANNLQPDSVYHMRVKIKFRNNYYYSTDITFIPQKAAAPAITALGNTLSSSVATGNQWYLNASIIPGATNQQYTAAASGAYTVTATQNGCPTLTSAAFNLTVTAIPDINAWGREIQIYPNPIVNDEINVIVHSSRRLILQISDITGRLVQEQELKNGVNKLSLPELQSGIYVFIIRDAKTFETVKRKMLKF